MVCEVFDINRSCYYAHRDRYKQVDVERLELRAKVNQVFKTSRSSAGSRTIKTKLNESEIELGTIEERADARDGRLSRRSGHGRDAGA